MSDVQLLLTEVSDNQIEISGIAKPDETFLKVAAVSVRPIKEALTIDPAEVATKLDSALLMASMGGKVEGDTLRFSMPVTIKKASKKPPYSIDDCGLNKLLEAAASDTMEKVAIDSFVDDLIRSIENAKVSSEGILDLKVPVKIRFEDERVKEAFMGLGRKRKAKKVASAVKTIYKKQLIDMAAEKLAKLMK